MVANKRSKLAGPPIEDLGSYSIFTKKGTFNKARILHWMKVGAQPTATVHNLLITQKVIEGKKVAVPIKHKDKKEGRE